jgi:hypothetical protein
VFRNPSRSLAAAFSTLVCLAAAHAAPVTIDSEQRAAGAVLSAHHFFIDRNELANTRQLLINLTHPSREIVNLGLSMLAGATTPAALTRAGGISVPCPQGGNVTAQLPRGLIRKLSMSFNGCVRELYSELDATYNGMVEVVLVGDKFNVSATPSLRLGTATQDFTITTFQSFPPYSDVTDTRSMNLRMTGLIPLSQRIAGFYFTGAFAYEVTGFWQSFTTIVPPDPMHGAPSEHVQRISAERILTSGHLSLPENSQTEWLDDETWFHTGRFTTYFDNVNLWRNTTETVDAQGLRIRTKELYGSGRQVAIDGRARLQWEPTRGAGCLSGDYVFKTRTPLVEPPLGVSGFYRQGEILINNVATSRYGAPTQPDPQQQPWLWQGPVSISVANLGQFDYLVDWSVSSGLKPIAGCSF